ncbi:protein lines [Aethina tumida]|uniref:protein lines n=1 Tax=Aethina tumida TaxID=116153 RepID=UPI002148D863|nr:protein lines [Aethina tumida]
MVLRQRENKMTSEQPLKKKLRRGDDTETADETDFIPTDLSVLHLTNEEDITRNSVNAQFHGEKSVYQTSDNSESETEKSDDNLVTESSSGNFSSPDSYVSTSPYNANSENISITPAPDIIQDYPYVNNSCLPLTFPVQNNIINASYSNHDRHTQSMSIATEGSSSESLGLDEFQERLIKQCLCGISEATLRKPFEGPQINDSSDSRTAMLSEWSTKSVLQFLSNLQLLFDVYLKQNNNGLICSKIVRICDTIVQNEYNLIEQIISLCETRDKYINFLAARVLSSLLIIAKTNINNEWLETILNFLTMENIDYDKIIFALEVVKRVVEWKDIEIHVLEDNESKDIAGPSSSSEFNVNCETESFSDAESYDTSAIKGLIIRSLESKWPELIHKIQNLISNNSSVQAQTCILTFLALWESTISVKANLSVVETKPFYAHFEIFVKKLSGNLSPIIWKQLLSLFNEVLCYGSTLALQDMLPDDTCQLAHLIVRRVKDHRLLDNLPFRRDGYTVNSFVGTIFSTQPDQSSIDRTLLQKIVLLVLKSVAITIKETRSDSSDSSIGSDDYDFYHNEMPLIERSIRDVLRKVDTFIKNSLDFHPEASFPKILVHLFSDQDDYMIESMVCTLDITVGISYRNAVFPDLINMLNPIHSFIEFLKIVSHDYDVLLDYLISNETCFLLYLLRFLKYTRRNWSRFLSSCGEGNELDNVMTVLIRLKMQISRLVSQDLFPYNINPVLRLLEVCENLYEGNEYS